MLFRMDLAPGKEIKVDLAWGSRWIWVDPDPQCCVRFDIIVFKSHKIIFKIESKFDKNVVRFEKNVGILSVNF